MGLFNILILHATPCPVCSTSQDWRIQYKYGLCRLLENQLGDQILLNSDTTETISTSGIAEEACKNCKHPEIEATISIKNGIITAVKLYPFKKNSERYP